MPLDSETLTHETLSSSEAEIDDNDIVEPDTPSSTDSDYRRALALSMAEAQQAPKAEDEDNDSELRAALLESDSAHRAHEEKLTRQQTEEEIVLEYVRKQSLLEHDHAKSKGKGSVPDAGVSGEGASGDVDTDDEELKKAIEESLRVSGKAGEKS